MEEDELNKPLGTLADEVDLLLGVQSIKAGDMQIALNRLKECYNSIAQHLEEEQHKVLQYEIRNLEMFCEIYASAMDKSIQRVYRHLSTTDAWKKAQEST